MIDNHPHLLERIELLNGDLLDQNSLIKETLAPIWHEKPEAAAKALNRLNR